MTLIAAGDADADADDVGDEDPEKGWTDEMQGREIVREGLVEQVVSVAMVAKLAHS